jgi:hypothetical protein
MRRQGVVCSAMCEALLLPGRRLCVVVVIRGHIGGSRNASQSLAAQMLVEARVRRSCWTVVRPAAACTSGSQQRDQEPLLAQGRSVGMYAHFNLPQAELWKCTPGSCRVDLQPASRRRER